MFFLWTKCKGILLIMFIASCRTHEHFSFVWSPLDHIHSKPPKSRTFFLCTKCKGILSTMFTASCQSHEHFSFLQNAKGSSRPHSQQAAEVTNIFPLYKIQRDPLDHIHSNPPESRTFLSPKSLESRTFLSAKSLEPRMVYLCTKCKPVLSTTFTASHQSHEPFAFVQN